MIVPHCTRNTAFVAKPGASVSKQERPPVERAQRNQDAGGQSVQTSSRAVLGRKRPLGEVLVRHEASELLKPRNSSTMLEWADLSPSRLSLIQSLKPTLLPGLAWGSFMQCLESRLRSLRAALAVWLATVAR